MKVFVEKLSTLLGVLATLATVAMMVAITADVSYRWFEGKSVPGLLEFSETMLVAAVFLGMAYTGATNGHIAVDLVTERVPTRFSRWMVASGWLLTVVILVWMLYANVLRAMTSFQTNEVRMGIVHWPLWPGRWILVVGLFAMLLVALANVWLTLRGEEVMGFKEFEFIATDTVTFNLAEAERADVTSLDAANEPVITGRMTGEAEPKEDNK